MYMTASTMSGRRSWTQLVTFGLVWIAYAATYLIRKGRLGASSSYGAHKVTKEANSFFVVICVLPPPPLQPLQRTVVIDVLSIRAGAANMTIPHD